MLKKGWVIVLAGGRGDEINRKRPPPIPFFDNGAKRPFCHFSLRSHENDEKTSLLGQKTSKKAIDRM
jgi:hypothetical protein